MEDGANPDHPEMIVRQYSDEDLESAVALFTDTVRHVNIHDYSPEQIAAWAPRTPDLAYWRSRLIGLTLWVAESGNHIIGFCGLMAAGHIDLFYVDYRFQRQGIGKRMYEQLETEARRNGGVRLFTEASITARPFFEKMGFETLCKQRVKFRGVVFENYAMEKCLRRSG